MHRMVLGFLVAAGCAASALAAEPSETGTLVFHVMDYESEVKIGKKIQAQLEHAGLKWGINEDVLVIPLVNEIYVNAELPYLTRYGATKSIDLKAGEYHITCIGFILRSNSQDVRKVLSKSAFFNERVLSFTIAPGKTTTLRVLPSMKKQSQLSFALYQTMFQPELKVTIIEDGAETEEMVINLPMTSTIPWDEYSGSLKFSDLPPQTVAKEGQPVADDEGSADRASGPTVSPGELLLEATKLKEKGFEVDLLIAFIHQKQLTAPLSVDDIVAWQEAGFDEEVIKAALECYAE